MMEQQDDGQPVPRRLVGIDRGIASRHSVRVLEADGTVVCRSSCVPTVASLSSVERAAVPSRAESGAAADRFTASGSHQPPCPDRVARRHRRWEQGGYRVDLVERAGHLKPMLVDFALSPRFDRELSAVIARNFPGGVVTDESLFSMVLDHFALQHRLPSGNTVVEAFIAAHPELTDAERDMLLGWQDVVEGVFEIAGKDRDALVLFNFLDELTYRAQSNLGRRAFKPVKNA
jgi:hypothetical protein